MPSTLTPSEREEREAERIRRPKPRPSRKNRERRAPRPEQRSKRIREPDSDVVQKSKDPDMSLNHKGYSSSLVDIAWSIAADPVAPKVKDPRIKTGIETTYGLLYRQAPAVADHFLSYSESHFSDNADADSILAGFKKIQRDLSTRLRDLQAAYRYVDKDDVAKTVTQNWPKDVNDWAGRAAVVGSLDRAIDSVPIPDPFKAPFLRGNPGDVIRDKELLRKIIDGASSRLNKGIDADVITKFAQLAAAWQIASKNPPTISLPDLTSNMEKLSEKVRAQSTELLRFGEIMDSWDKAMSDLGPSDGRNDWKPGDDLERVVSDIRSFLSRRSVPVDPSASMKALQEHTESKFGKVPPTLEAVFKGFKSKAASNGTSSIEDMTFKTAQYHGTIQQGHPTDTTNTPWRSIDKRYIGEKHFKSIVKAAKVLLKEEWMTWEGGAPDMKFREALDLAIQIADGNIYQGKIDPETYDLLLNRLAGWGHDNFSDTILPMKAVSSRSSSTMIQHIKNIVRVASDLRQKDPAAALEILKNIRSLVSTEADSQTIREHVGAGEVPEAFAAPQEQTSTEQGDTIEFNSMGDGDLDKLKEDAKKLLDSKDVEEFMKNFDTLHGGMKKTSSLSSEVSVTLGELVRIAQTYPNTRPVLLPIIVAAKKKAPKKKGKSPFGGKGAPPFGKKGEKDEKKDPPKTAKPKGKVKKASLEIEADDINW